MSRLAVVVTASARSQQVHVQMCCPALSRILRVEVWLNHEIELLRRRRSALVVGRLEFGVRVIAVAEIILSCLS